jgi:pimeloyl-ACP methyl ester carboxylesterase
MTAFPKPTSAPTQPQAQGEIVVHDRRITVDGVETQYLEAGAGPPLLLLHGHEQSATSWRWVIPALAQTRRVLAPSLPGHGESGPAPAGHAPGADLAPFAAAFCSAVAPGEPVDLVGHSAGGAIALRLTLADPARIRTLTLVDSAGLGREVHPLLALDTLPVIGELAVMISRMPGGDLARTTMSAAMLFAQPWRIPSEFFTEQHALGHRPGQLEASTVMARALFGPHGQRQILLDRLPALATPTLIIWGDRDYLLPVQQAHAAAASLPHGQLSVFPDCGHLPHVEHPDRFATVLSTWLTDTLEGPTTAIARCPLGVVHARRAHVGEAESASQTLQAKRLRETGDITEHPEYEQAGRDLRLGEQLRAIRRSRNLTQKE